MYNYLVKSIHLMVNFLSCLCFNSLWKPSCSIVDSQVKSQSLTFHYQIIINHYYLQGSFENPMAEFEWIKINNLFLLKCFNFFNFSCRLSRQNLLICSCSKNDSGFIFWNNLDEIKSQFDFLMLMAIMLCYQIPWDFYLIFKKLSC